MNEFTSLNESLLSGGKLVKQVVKLVFQNRMQSGSYRMHRMHRIASYRIVRMKEQTNEGILVLDKDYDYIFLA